MIGKIGANFMQIGCVSERPTSSSTQRNPSFAPYRAVECQYCLANVYVLERSFQSQCGQRVRNHLTKCPNFSGVLAPLPRSRSVDVRKKPFANQIPYKQLHIEKGGGLGRHEFSSLLRCLASGTRARESRTDDVHIGRDRDVLFEWEKPLSFYL